MNTFKLMVLCMALFVLADLSMAQDDVPSLDPSLLVTTPRLSPDDIPEESPEEGCEDKLRRHIDELLKKDHKGILEAQLNLTILKLAQRTIKGGHKSLEEMIKKDMAKLNELSSQNPATLDRLHQLYDANANQDIQSVYSKVESLKVSSTGLNYITGKKIENDSVASFILYDSMVNEKNSPFNKNDVAITWLAKKIRAQNKSSSLSISDQVARYTGLVQNTKAASSSTINSKIETEKKRVDGFMADAKKTFMLANPDCAQDSEFNQQCLTVANNMAPDLLLDIDNLNSKVANNFSYAMKGRIFGGGSLVGQKLNTCEGKYYDLSKAKVLHSTRTTLGTPDKHAIHHHDHAQHGPKLSPTFGPIKCNWHGKKFQIEHFVDRKEQCCQDKITKFVEYAPYVMIEQGADCRFFYGIPYVAEVGVKGGVEFELGLGGKITLDLKTCEDQGCLSGKGKFRPFLAIYGELGAGLASVEGGVRWEPYIEIKYCKSRGAASGEGKVEAVMGTAWLYGQYSLGWGMQQSSFNYALASSSAKLKIYSF
jgi:hypothetical protein